MVLGCKYVPHFSFLLSVSHFVWSNMTVFCIVPSFGIMNLIFRDLERRIVEVEMDLTLAKSQGYLKHQLRQSKSSSDQKLLAVIGVYTGFGSHLKRNTFRGSWMPRGEYGGFLIAKA